MCTDIAHRSSGRLERVRADIGGSLGIVDIFEGGNIWHVQDFVHEIYQWNFLRSKRLTPIIFQFFKSFQDISFWVKVITNKF